MAGAAPAAPTAPAAPATDSKRIWVKGLMFPGGIKHYEEFAQYLVIYRDESAKLKKGEKISYDSWMKVYTYIRCVVHMNSIVIAKMLPSQVLNSLNDKLSLIDSLRKIEASVVHPMTKQIATGNIILLSVFVDMEVKMKNPTLFIHTEINMLDY